MPIRVLHINRNFIFNKLHQLLIDELDKNQVIRNRVFVPTSLEQNRDCTVGENVIVSKCFRIRDKFFYHYKQEKIYKSLITHFQVKEFDIVHAYTLFTDGGCAYRIHEKYGIPYVVAIRNTDINDFYKKIPFFRGYGTRILNKAEAIFFLSESYRAELFDNYISEKNKESLWAKSYVIPNGVDSFWLANCPSSKNSLSNGQINIIYAGRIDQNKNIETTAKAIELLHQDGIKSSFTIIGRIEDEQVYERLCNRYSFIIYKPEMNKEELIYEYRNNDIFVMPSFTESFGLSYVEAMSQGLPVIYTKGQGFDRQFDEGVVGYHVDPNNPRDVANKICSIITKYDIVASNCISASQNYDWSIISDKYVSIYQKIKDKSKNEDVLSINYK